MIQEETHVRRRITATVDNVVCIVDVGKLVEHICLVGTQYKHNLVVRGVLDREAQSLINIGRAIKAHPTHVYSTIAKHHLKKKLAHFVLRIFTTCRDVNIGIVSMRQHLLDELAVARVGYVEASERGSAGVEHLGLFHHAVSMARFQRKRKGLVGRVYRTSLQSRK